MRKHDHFSFLYKTTYCKKLASWLKGKNKALKTNTKKTEEFQTEFKENKEKTNSFRTTLPLPLDTLEMEIGLKSVTGAHSETTETTSRKNSRTWWGHRKSCGDLANMTSFPRKGIQINMSRTSVLVILLILIPAGLAQYPNLPGKIEAWQKNVLGFYM